VTGALISVGALALIGRYGATEVRLTAFLLPATLLGFFAASRLRGLVDRAGVRPLVLALSAASALAVLVRAIR